MNSCKKTRNDLIEFCSGVLDRTTQTEVEDHLANCRMCTTAMTDLNDTVLTMREIPDPGIVYWDKLEQWVTHECDATREKNLCLHSIVSLISCRPWLTASIAIILLVGSSVLLVGSLIENLYFDITARQFSVLQDKPKQFLWRYNAQKQVSHSGSIQAFSATVAINPFELGVVFAELTAAIAAQEKRLTHKKIDAISQILTQGKRNLGLANPDAWQTIIAQDKWGILAVKSQRLQAQLHARLSTRANLRSEFYLGAWLVNFQLGLIAGRLERQMQLQYIGLLTEKIADIAQANALLRQLTDIMQILQIQTLGHQEFAQLQQRLRNISYIMGD